MGRLVGISTRGLHLKEKDRQLVIEQAGRIIAQIPLEDVDSLVLDETAITMSGKVLLGLIKNHASVVVCDEWHLPVGLCLSFTQNRLMPERTRLFLEASEPKKKRLWQKLIQAKIIFQSQNLKPKSYEREMLRKYSEEVRSGDPDNREAVAARLYWEHIFSDFDSEFRRSNQSRINDCLNYLYSIVRSSIARSLCASGFLPVFAIFHSSRDNAFALADDFLEIYRPFCDRWLWHLISESGISGDGLSYPGEGKASLLLPKERLMELLVQFVFMSGERVTVMTAVERSCSSLLLALESNHHIQVPDACIFLDIE